MTLEEGFGWIEEMNAEIRMIMRQKDDMLAVIVERHCPYKIGEVVPVQGVYHSAGKHLQIRFRTLDKKGSEWRWILTGPIVRKSDNSVGTMPCKSIVKVNLDEPYAEEPKVSQGAGV